MVANAKLKLTPDQIDESSSEPLYQQIYLLLKEKIESGKLGTNMRLPAEQELTQMLGVSRITVKRALNELATSGLVHRKRGRGTIVTFDATAPMVKGSFENLIDGLVQMGLETEVKLLDCSRIKADKELSERLELSSKQKVQRIVRLRELESEPLSYLITHIPGDVADGYDEAELARESLIALLTKAGHAPVAAEQSITAAAAEPAIAAVLGIATGAPLLRIHRTMRDADGRVVQDITAHYRSDKFEYHMRLTRASNQNWEADG